MKILIISDIHGNLPALETCLKCLKNIDLVISLGDVVNFGPWSNECVDLLDSLKNTITIFGNHEKNFIAGKSESKSIIENAFFKKTYPDFKRLDIIKKYEEKVNLFNFEIVHSIKNDYIFRDTDILIDKNIILGHSHQMYVREINKFLLVNPGSVGLNRKNFNVMNYIIWHKDKNKFESFNKEISPNKYLSEIKKLEYPQICIDYIKSKI